jgi:hypothetical protein
MLSKIRRLVMNQFTVCPRTGRITQREMTERKSLWLWIVVGLASATWVLIRVVPKPSRATYPCQRVAQPLAAGFVVWLVGLAGSALIMRRARRLFQSQRHILGAICLATTVLLCFGALGDMRDVAASTEGFVPTDPANSPVGTGKGIHPGRVVWVYDNQLCDHGSSDSSWWSDENTDPQVAMNMMTMAITKLTGISNPVAAWDSVFKYFNKERYGLDDRGYHTGEKIAIKINNIESRFYEWDKTQTNRYSPQMIHALIWHLVNYAGVPDEDITFYDCVFYHGDPVYKYCHKDFPGVRWAEGDCTDRADGHGYENGPGDNPGTREKVVADSTCRIFYSDTNLTYFPENKGKVCLPTVVTEAKYIISYCLPRQHTDLAGVTCCAKNFFGSVFHPNPPGTNSYYYHGWCPYFMHYGVSALPGKGWPQLPMGSYNALVDLMGHKELGGKTFLLLGERLRKITWSIAPFNGGPASSLFMSQDFVAMESVLLDFLRCSNDGVPSGTVDNYLHEAAQANNPPSGVFYDPEGDGTRLTSLGVHEHWNNSTAKQYTRNLGTGEGIELVQVLNPTTTAVEGSKNDFPGTFALLSNYPNPFNPSTTICYSLPTSADIRLNIYTVSGAKVRTLIDQHQSAGTFQIQWNGRNDDDVRVASGIYICRIERNTGRETDSQSHQMLLLK